MAALRHSGKSRRFSQATVSRVRNQDATLSVGEDARSRILRIAELHYQKKEAANSASTS